MTINFNSLSPFFVNGAINNVGATIAPRLESIPSIVLRTRVGEILEFRVQILPIELYQLLSLIDEVSPFTEAEKDAIAAGLSEVNYPPYEPIDIDEAFRLRMTIDFNYVVNAFNRGLAKPLLVRLLTSPQVDGKAFAYLLTVLQHPNARPDDFYSAMSLTLQNFELTEAEQAIVTQVLAESGLASYAPNTFQLN